MRISMLQALSLSRKPILAFGAMGAGWAAFAAFAPQIKASLGASDGAFGLVLLGAPVGLMTSMWLAPLADARLGRLAMPVASGALGLSFVPVMLVASSGGPLWLFAAAMVVVGLCSGLTDVVMNSRVSEIEAARDVSLMNLNHGMFSVVYAVSAFCTGIAREGGVPPAAVFAVIAGLGLLATPWMRVAVAPPIPAAPGAEAWGFPRAVVFWGGAIVLVAFMSENAVEAWSALHLERTLGGNAAEGAGGPAMLGLTMAVGRLSGQVVAGRVAEATVLRWGAVLAAAGGVVVATAPTTLVAYAGFGAMGLGISVLAPMALALVGRRVDGRHRTRAIARVAVIGFLGFFIGPTVMGGLSQAFGLRIAFLVVAVLLLAVPAVLVMLRRIPRQDAGVSQAAP